MNPVLEKIVQVLDVERIEDNLYRGVNHEPGHVFGGQVLAQAIASAFRTVDPGRRLHSTHGYFLRAGDWRRPIAYEVDRIRDGKSFTTRRVVAIQHGKAIFNMACSWHARETGLTHSQPMPDVPPPEALREDLAAYRALSADNPEMERFAFRFEAIDSRQVEGLLMHHPEAHEPQKHTWLKTRDPLPDSTEVHLALLAYMSDLDFMSTSLLPHAVAPRARGSDQAGGRPRVIGASLDHALWLHRPFRADEWLLFAKTSPNASGARGFVRGQFFNRDGELVATAAQECLIRPVDDDAPGAQRS